MTVNDADLAVVVGVDDSEGAVAAVRWAARYASATGAPLRLLHASASPGTATVVPPVPESPGRETSGDRVLAAAAAEAARYEPRPRVSTHATVDDPVPALLQASSEAGLLVLGTRDRGRMATALTGSVAAKVVAAARCPVVVVRGEPHPSGPVVVAVDASDSGEPALRFAFREASRRQCALVAVHAWQPALVPTGTGTMAAAAAASAPSREELVTAARHTLTDAVARWRAVFPDVAVQERLVDGHPDNAVAEETSGAALVVVGSHGRGPLAGFLLGSTSQALVHRSACPVAVVRQPGDEPPD